MHELRRYEINHGIGPACKCLSRVEVTEIDKHASLVGYYQMELIMTLKV